MLKDTKSLGNNKAPACESRGFVHKKRSRAFLHPLLHFQIEPSFPNVKKAIRKAVLNNGRSIIDFLESWGDDLMDVNQKEVEKVL